MRRLNSRIGSSFLIFLIANTGLIFNCPGDYYSLVPDEAKSPAPGK
jgi:hypothetical protein